MIVSFAPIFFVDMIGSVLMILLSIMCLHLAIDLKKREPDNVIWTYLLWVCLALTAFAFSRSAGHIMKNILSLVGHDELWAKISPLSGGINSIMFTVVAAVTLFFGQTWDIYRKIVGDKKILQGTRDELLFCNQNLEDLVQLRTRELTRSQHKYKRIFEISKDMILVTAKDGQILAVNPAGSQILGCEESVDPVDGKNFRIYFDDAADFDRLRNMLAAQGAVTNEEILLKRENGTRALCLVSAGLDRGLPEREDTLHFLVKDIENRRIIEQQMAQADKLASIGELSAGVAHEINNPLGIILGYTQLMLREQTDEAETYNDLKTIEKHVKSCKSIVEDLLNFARSSKTIKERLKITDIVEDVIGFVEQHANTGKIRIERDYDKTTPSLQLDEKKMRQVFMNLIMNAIHAVDETGRIRIESRWDSEKEQVHVTINDNGCGIEQKNLSKIFDPFFTTKPTGKGTGLGLSVSYGIIKNHNGDIRVESAPGQGSRFSVVLPVEPVKPEQKK